MAEVDQVAAETVALRIGQLELLLDFAKRVEQVNANDGKEWYRNMIRTLSDIAEDAGNMESMLTARAVHLKVLTPTEAANAALISRNAVYKRVKAHYDESSIPDET